MSTIASPVKLLLVVLLIICLFMNLNDQTYNYNAYTFLNSLSELGSMPIPLDFAFNITANTGLDGLDTFLNVLLVPIQLLLSVVVVLANGFIFVFKLVQSYLLVN